MKTKLCVLIFLLAAALVQAQTNNLAALLQSGLFEEQANRNLDAAIADYSSLATQFDKDQQMAATAVFRIGECYRAQGKTNEAAAQYERVLRDFSDQTTLATLSRQNLTGLGIATSEESSADNSGKQLWDKVKNLPPSELEKVLPTLAPDAVLTSLLQQRNEAETKLAQLQTDYAPVNPEVVRQKAVLDTISKQILGKIDGIMQALKLRADLSQTVATTSAPTDDENQEIQRIQQMISDSPDLINTRAPGSGSTPLEKAASAGWIKVATYLLDHGADVNADLGNALYDAAKAGNRAMVELLLSRGADVNPKEHTGQTPLHIAVENGFQAVVEVLLANNADVNAQIGSGVTPLFLAAGRDNPKIVSLLLEHKAGVNAQDQSGATPLINAAYSDYPENIKLLLAAGADPNLVNNDDNSVATGGRRGGGTVFKGRTALSFTAEKNSPEMVKMLLDAKADPNGGGLDAPLLVAINNKDASSAELLLQVGANPNMEKNVDWGFFKQGTTYYGAGHPSETPLFLAVSAKQLPMVQLLLKFKADPDHSQTDGRSLLFSALSDTNILEALLDAGAKVDVHDETDIINNQVIKRTLLDSAVDQNNAIAVELLLKHGANPDMQDARGNAALHWAAYNLSDENVFRLLLDYKANPNVRGSESTPLDLVKRALQHNFWGDRFGNSSGQNVPPEQKELAEKLIALLHQHGALDKLPDWDHIAVSRPSANFSHAVFQKGTNDWNQFTLLEAILNFYQSQSPFPSAAPTFQQRLAQIQSYSGSLAFPDLEQIVIVRHRPGTTNETRIKINLLNSTNGIDCAKDVPLEFGDVVEIPERNHALGDRPVGLAYDQQEIIADYLKGNVQLVTHDQKVELPIYSTPEGSWIGSVMQKPEAQKVLLSSSDLARVKVIRSDAKTGKKHEWIIDCWDSRNGYNASDLWLRDGDVIEVPEKP